MDRGGEEAGRSEGATSGEADGGGTVEAHIRRIDVEVAAAEDVSGYTGRNVVAVDGNFARFDAEGAGSVEYEKKERHQRDREAQLAMQMADAVEDDAHAVARSLIALLSSLKSALSEVTTNSVANMRIENEAAGQVQDAAVDAATKGNRFINACLRLNEEMKGMERVAAQLEALKLKVDHVESQASRYLPR